MLHGLLALKYKNSGAPITRLQLSSKTWFADVKNQDIKCPVIESCPDNPILWFFTSGYQVSGYQTMHWYPDFLRSGYRSIRILKHPDIKCPVIKSWILYALISGYFKDPISRHPDIEASGKVKSESCFFDTLIFGRSVIGVII